MEISNSNIRGNPILKLRRVFSKKRIFIIFLLAITFLGVGVGGIAWGGYLQKAGKGKMLISKFISIFDVNISVVPNMVKATTVDIERLYIDIKFIDSEKLRYQREIAFKNEKMTVNEQQPVPAKIRYDNNTYKVDISLTGANPDHYGDPIKWSYSIKVKGGKTIMGMRKFNLLIPFTRGYLTDWIGTRLSKARGIIGIRQDFVDITINGSDLGVYYLEEKFDKLLVESNQKRDGIIFRIINNNVVPYQLKKVNNNTELHTQFILLKRLWQSFLNNQINPEKLFDLKKMASMAVITDLLRTKHGLMAVNQRFYFNPVTKLCEPILKENELLFHSSKVYGLLPIKFEKAIQIEGPNINARYYSVIEKNPVWIVINDNVLFEEYYLKEAAILTNRQYLDSVLCSDGLLDILVSKVQKEDPFYIFPKESLFESQEFIRDRLYPAVPSIDVFYKTFSNHSVTFVMENKINLPVEILSLNYNNRIEITPPKRLILKARYKYDNIFPEIKLGLPTNIDHGSFSVDSLEVFYSVLGLNEIRKAIVYTQVMSKSDFERLNPTKQPTNIHEFDFLTINNNNTIDFSEIKCDLYEDLIIPQGYIVSAVPGCQINLHNSAKIISYSPLRFFGKSDSLITITSTDSTGQGMIVFNCEHTSELSYVKFNDLSNISDIGWNLTGAVTFYEAPVNINNCTFRNNLNGDDYLNIIRTNFNITNTKFENTYADAFDADFCTGSIISATFINIGNDAIDVSGSKLKLKTIGIEYPGDKGISAGERSHLICKDIDITGGEIAIASKDNSIIELNNINITSCKLAYVAFQKKSEFGPGKIVVKNAISVDVETEYLVENGSSLSINGNQINKKSKKVKEMLYGKEYGKSSK